MIYSLFTTSTAVVFKQNATEMAEQRFKVSAVTAGWYSALLQYAGFFIVPVVGICIDLFGQRVTLSKLSLVTIYHTPLSCAVILTYLLSSGNWRSGNIHSHGSGPMGRRGQGHSGGLRYLCRCLLVQSYSHYRWHANFALPSDRLRHCVLAEDHDEQLVRNDMTDTLHPNPLTVPFQDQHHRPYPGRCHPRCRPQLLQQSGHSLPRARGLLAVRLACAGDARLFLRRPRRDAVEPEAAPGAGREAARDEARILRDQGITEPHHLQNVFRPVDLLAFGRMVGLHLGGCHGRQEDLV